MRVYANPDYIYMQLYEPSATIPVHTFNMCNIVYQSKMTYTQGNTGIANM